MAIFVPAEIVYSYITSAADAEAVGCPVEISKSLLLLSNKPTPRRRQKRGNPDAENHAGDDDDRIFYQRRTGDG